MKSILPVRGRTVALAALSAVLLGLVLGGVDAYAVPPTVTGGFSSDTVVKVAAPAGAAAVLAPDRRTAVAPVGAPQQVVRAIAAANRITDKPYKYGGGHGRWRDSGYDCSGAVSYVLHAAEFLRTARNSSGLIGWGARGVGEWITVYTHGGHAYAVIAGLRFDTSGPGEEGPRWRLEPSGDSGFVERHPAGL